MGVEGDADGFRGDQLGRRTGVSGDLAFQPFYFGNVKAAGKFFEDSVLGDVEGNVPDNGLSIKTMNRCKKAKIVSREAGV